MTMSGRGSPLCSISHERLEVLRYGQTSGKSMKPCFLRSLVRQRAQQPPILNTQARERDDRGEVMQRSDRLSLSGRVTGPERRGSPTVAS